MLAEHGEAIEADLLRWYHVDILDLGTERLSWRRLGSLIRHLPRESWYVQADVGEAAAWSVTDHLIAALFDAQQAGNWMFASANSKSKVQKPKPLPRPGERETRLGRGRGYTIEEMQQIQANWSVLATGEAPVIEL